jgi:hypothetical protein
MMMTPIPTRTIEECERIVTMWDEGQRAKVLKMLGAEPSDHFLKTFRTPKPKKAKERAPRKKQ